LYHDKQQKSDNKLLAMFTECTMTRNLEQHVRLTEHITDTQQLNKQTTEAKNFTTNKDTSKGCNK